MLIKCFKKYKLRVVHFDSCHGEVTMILKYKTLKQLKEAAEYISLYPNTICEVL